MIARILDFEVKMEKKDEFVKVMKNEILPILKRQNGFQEILPFFPERMKDRIFAITLWTSKKDVERYERETYPRVFDIVKPFMTTPVGVNYYNLETTLCQHFMESLAA